MQILSAVPLWVFPLLMVLVLVGLRARHDRETPVALYYPLALLGLLSLFRAFSLGTLAVWALIIGWLAGVMVGQALQPRWTVSRDARRVRVRGEYVTLATVLSLFGANFAAGMAAGMAPDLAQGTEFGLAYGLFCGLLSGSLAGRTLSILRTPRG